MDRTFRLLLLILPTDIARSPQAISQNCTIGRRRTRPDQLRPLHLESSLSERLIQISE